MKHEAFHYHSLEEIRAAAEACGVNLPLSGDLSSLFEPLSLGICAAENRIALQPMEGTDGTEDGAPGELTDSLVPVIVDRLQPIDLATLIENAVDRGLIAGLKGSAAQLIAEGVAEQLAHEFMRGHSVAFGQYFYGRPYLSGQVSANGNLTSPVEVVTT